MQTKSKTVSMKHCEKTHQVFEIRVKKHTSMKSNIWVTTELCEKVS